ncbi:MULTISPECIES: flagellar hook assembly protein FlgD [unclassified Massilia]|uniref:flagellar hook assembly protein FlgD n=1 Tax=unclassified Massilia TaxID=2609279 RepID=UPI00177CAC29|nr:MULTISPECIES: flagellar hook assembly protein FlgD [unclassified Massilia]MBD8528809.1 flagellar hook assembly protein FlgD [Massilia sp. CFBP 13647]MBD8673450.1 flagellar hook assembly protein FlgD [Massilia sp. CFBP 13721]
MTTVNATGGTSITDLMSTMNATRKESTDSVQADTDKFMTLLVTQLKNQDPLNPLDNAQVTSQLAQLQTVTGVNKLNETLETLKSSYQSSESMQATNLIGHGVLVEGNTLNLSGGKSVFGVDLATAADNVQVIVTDPRTGKDVATIDLGAAEAGAMPLAWDGTSDSVDAAMLADGRYSFRIAATLAGQPLTDVKALTLDTVASVSTNTKDGVKLNLAGKGAISLADIKQVL